MVEVTRPKALARKRVEEGALEKGFDVPVCCQIWEESERGWGTKSDGYSLHLSLEDRDIFVKKANDDQHAYFVSRGLGVGQVPDEYSRTSGEPYFTTVEASVLAELQRVTMSGHNGLRVWDGPAPKRVRSF